MILGPGNGTCEEQGARRTDYCPLLKFPLVRDYAVLHMWLNAHGRRDAGRRSEARLTSAELTFNGAD
jgi:hypothetical protein